MIEQIRELLVELVGRFGDRTPIAFMIIFVGGFMIIYLGSIISESKTKLGLLFYILGFLCLVFGSSMIKVYFDLHQG